MIKVLFLLAFAISAKAQIVEPALPEIAKQFHNVRDFTLYENEAYFSAQNTLGNTSVIIRVMKTNNEWGKPSIASFSGEFNDIEPFISQDGLQLYFASKRPKGDSNESKDYDIWVVSRNALQESWSEPANLGPAINTDKNEFYPSLAINGNLYFTANKEDSKGKDDIYLSEFKEGKYQTSHSIGKNINTAGDEYNAFIAPNEMYILFGAYKRPDSLGSGDLYISYKDKDGNWSPAKNMGDKVNSRFMDYCPFVDIKNNTLYFTSKRVNKGSSQFKNIESLLEQFNAYENGMSRIYKTKI